MTTSTKQPKPTFFESKIRDMGFYIVWDKWAGCFKFVVQYNPTKSYKIHELHECEQKQAQALIDAF